MKLTACCIYKQFNLFELTHEPMVCTGFATEGIYNSVAQRWRCRRVGFSELLACNTEMGVAMGSRPSLLLHEFIAALLGNTTLSAMIEHPFWARAVGVLTYHCLVDRNRTKTVIWDIRSDVAFHGPGSFRVFALILFF